MVGGSTIHILLAFQSAQPALPDHPALPTVSPTICEDPAQRAALEKRLLAEPDAWNPENRAKLAHERGKVRTDELIARINRFAKRANWTKNQEGKFVGSMWNDPKILEMRREPTRLVIKMGQLAVESKAEPDEAKQCLILAKTFELQTQLDTSAERINAAMAELLEAEAKKLGIHAD